MKILRFILIAACFGSLPSLFAQEAPNAATPAAPEAEPAPTSFAALVKNSPFKSIAKLNARGGLRAAQNTQLRFQGMLTIAGETEFGIYDSVAQKSYWLKLRKRGNTGIVVESFNAELKSVTVQTGSGKQVLALVTPDEKPLAISGRTSYAPVVMVNSQQQNNNNSRQESFQRRVAQSRNAQAQNNNSRRNNSRSR